MCVYHGTCLVLGSQLHMHEGYTAPSNVSQTVVWKHCQQPTLVTAWGSAPCFKSRDTISRCPSWHAMWKGVKPSCAYAKETVHVTYLIYTEFAMQNQLDTTIEGKWETKETNKKHGSHYKETWLIWCAPWAPTPIAASMSAQYLIRFRFRLSFLPILATNSWQFLILQRSYQHS